MSLSSRFTSTIGRSISRELRSSPGAVRNLSSQWPRSLASETGSIAVASNRVVFQGQPSNAGDCYRGFSTKQEATETTESEPESKESASESESPESADAEEKVDKTAELEKQIKDLKDNLLRSLAEQENTRRIAKRDVESARAFAISSFAKSLLDASDNLSRALVAVPEELRHDHENNAVLATLYEGIEMTDAGLIKAFAKNGLTKYGEAGEKFDPNLHHVLFEYPDPNGTPGHIGQVMKAGFMLNNRAVRPAEVGVVKAP